MSELELDAVLLVPGWRNPKNGKLHIRRDCRAVEWYAQNMTPVLCRFNVEGEAYRVLADREHLCRYCFPSGLTIDAA